MENEIDFLTEGARALGVELERGKCEKLVDFKRRVLEANKLFNLTAITNDEEFLIKHILDSLSASPLISRGARLLDIGSGAGFPAMPLAIAREDIFVVALDATLKKTTFLSEAARELNVTNLTAVSGRAEEKRELFCTFDFVTARAVAPLTILLELASPMLKAGGTFVAYKTDENEVYLAKEALKVLNMKFEGAKRLTLPNGDGRSLLLFEQVLPCPKRYPRQFGAIKKHPL